MMCRSSVLRGSTTWTLAESVISSFLGANKSLKFIIDGDQVHLVSCALPTYQLISSVNLFDAVVEETLYAHHEQFGYGSTSLLAMCYFWSKQFELLVEKGLQVTDIIDGTRKAINYVISVLPSIALSTEELLSSVKSDLRQSQRNLPQKGPYNNHVPFRGHSNLNQQKCPFTQFRTAKSNFKKANSNFEDGIAYGIKLRSRHLAASLSLEENEEENLNITENAETDNPVGVCLSEKSVGELLSFTKKVCHGDFNIVLADAWKQQMKAKSSFMFQTDLLSIISSVGCKSIDLVNGLLLETKCIDRKFLENKKKHRLLLINGDLTMSYMHLGFSPTISIEIPKTFDQLGKSHYSNWISDCTSHLLKLQVSILLVTGAVDNAIEDFCRSQLILLIDHIPWKTLNKLSKASNIASVSYLLDSDEKNVSSNIFIETWPAKQPDCDITHLCLQSTQSKDILQTIVLSHPYPPLVKLSEHLFWHSVSRLTQAINSSSLLPGCGYTEKWCSKKLSDWSKTLKQDYEREITQHLAEGYLNYYEAILKNRTEVDDEENVFDNIQSKCEMWHSALNLCFCHLTTDSQIVNGCDDVAAHNFSKSHLHLGTL